MSEIKQIPFEPLISPPTFPRGDKVKNAALYVIIPVFNSQRYRSRWIYTSEFIKYALDCGAHVISIEACFGERQSVLSNEIVHERYANIVVTTSSELWIKENLLNLAAQQLPEDWLYCAFIDPDIQFARKDWVSETIQQLQHYSVVQMFNIAVDLDPHNKPYQFNRGFVYDYLEGVPFKMQFTKKIPVTNYRQRIENTDPYCDDCPGGELKINHYHGGFAWAYRREAFNDLGGLFDLAILGAADSHMAASLIGKCEETIHPEMSDEYKVLIMEWQHRATQYIKRNIGYVDGSIYHYFHGAKKNRQYGSRWKILVNNKYTPSLDVKRSWNGVYQLTDHNLKLRDEIRKYLGSRKEDNMDMEGDLGFLD